MVRDGRFANRSCLYIREFSDAKLQRFLLTWCEKGLRQSPEKALTGLPDGLGLYPVYMLLAGYALENLFKGIIICGMWLEDHNSIDSIKDFEKLQVLVKGSITQTMPIKQHDLICCLLLGT